MAPLAGRKRRLMRFALAALLLALLLAASVSPAAAVVTIGSNLEREPDVHSTYWPRPTFSNFSLASKYQAPGGLASPVKGTVVRWRIRVGDVTVATNFRIIRPLGGGSFTGAGTTGQVTPPIGATTTYTAKTPLPIRIGDYIGLDCCNNPAGAEFLVFDPSARRIAWQPRLVDGGAGRPPGSSSYTAEIPLNADIEPTSTFSLGAITRNEKNGTATLMAKVPNAGELTGAGKGVNAAVISKTVSAPGSVRLLIKARGQKKEKLNSTGKVKVKPKITYTPTGGDPSTQSTKATLKKKL